MDIQRAIEYVETRGSSLEKVRLNCILNGTIAAPEAIQDFIQLQNGDGGFPFEMTPGKLSTINDTTVALWWMEELNLLASDQVEKVFGYLISVQSADGSWDDDPRIAQYDLPPWIQLGDMKTRLYLTAYATYWLAIGGYLHLPSIDKALDFLCAHQESSGKFSGYLHTSWIATSAFLLAGKRYIDVAVKGLQGLSIMVIADWGDSQIAWAMDCLSKGGLSKSHPLIECGLVELSRRQRADGSWASEDGEAFAVGATLQALKVLRRYGLAILSASDG